MGQMSIKKKKLKELKAEADNAFNAKQQAYQNRKAKFDELLSLVNQHNAKLWDDYKIKCNDNGKHIAKYKEQADILHEEMVSLFESSQEAYYSHDGALAKELSIEGHKKQETLKFYNEKVQELCEEASRLNEKAKGYAQKHQLPKSVNTLLKMELSILQEKFVRNEEWNLFKKTLNDAKFYDAEFHRLSSEYDKKQEAYKNYMQHGDDLALNNMVDTRGKQNYINQKVGDGIYEGFFEGVPAIIKISDLKNSYQMQIFYGGKDRPDGEGHSHVNVVKGELKFWREDGVVIYQVDKNTQVNKL